MPGLVFSRFFESPGVSVDGSDDRMMNEAIDDGGDTSGSREDRGPVGENGIGRENDGLVFVAPGDDFEEEVGVMSTVGKVPDFVDNEDFGATDCLDSAGQAG